MDDIDEQLSNRSGNCIEGFIATLGWIKHEWFYCPAGWLEVGG
jgi:hypothetical protein